MTPVEGCLNRALSLGGHYIVVAGKTPKLKVLCNYVQNVFHVSWTESKYHKEMITQSRLNVK